MSHHASDFCFLICEYEACSLLIRSDSHKDALKCNLHFLLYVCDYIIMTFSKEKQRKMGIKLTIKVNKVGTQQSDYMKENLYIAEVLD